MSALLWRKPRQDGETHSRADTLKFCVSFSDNVIGNPNGAGLVEVWRGT